MSLLTTDPTNKIDDSCIPEGANIDNAKLEHRPAYVYNQAGGADAVAETRILIPASYATSTVLQAWATPDTVPTGGTKTLTIDLKKSHAGGAWTSILSSTLTISGSSTARTPLAIALSGTPQLLAGDALQIVITIGGTGGTGVQGLGVVVNCAENGA